MITTGSDLTPDLALHGGQGLYTMNVLTDQGRGKGIHVRKIVVHQTNKYVGLSRCVAQA